MLNAIASEWIKTRKNRMFLTGSILVLSIPFLMILKALFLDGQRGANTEWFSSALMLHSLILPAAGGFVITSSVQKEYQDKTLRNILAAPASRSHFVAAKLAVWVIWHTVTFCLAGIVLLIGFYFLFPSEFTPGNLRCTLYSFIQNSIFSFVSILPVLWIALKQETLFYPSILAVLGFTILQAVGRQVSEALILPASLCPWTAVSVSGMTAFGSRYFLLCSASVFLCGFIGTIGAFAAFQKQEL